MIIELWRGAGGFSLMLRGHRPPKHHPVLDCAIRADNWDEVEEALPALLAVSGRDLEDLPIVGDLKEVLKVKAEDYINEKDPGGSGPVANLVYEEASRIRHGKKP